MIVPAACFLFVAALLFACVRGSKKARRENFFVSLAMFSGAIFGVFGLLLLVAFPDEFRHFVEYNF